MEEVINQDKNLPKKYEVKYIEKIDEYLFIETDITSLIISENNCYDVGKYKYIYKVYKMGDDLMAVLGKNYRQYLVNVQTKEVILEQSASYYSGIFKIDDDYVETMGPDHNKQVFNVREKKFIEPQIDLDIEYYYRVGENLFHYQKNDYTNQIYQNFVVYKDGRIVYELGDGFPYYVDGSLIISYRKDDTVTIVHDVLNTGYPIVTISKNDKVSSNALIHTKKNVADFLVFVSDHKLKVLDFDLNSTKEYDLGEEGDDYEIQLWRDIAVVIVTKEEKKHCIAINLNNGAMVKHQGIWILPLDDPGPQVIRGCDVLGNDRIFTIYDLDGIEYTHHTASDCFTLHSAKMNKVLYRDVDGTDNSLVYNIDTKEERVVPWTSPEYGVKEDGGYMEYGYGFRTFRSWDDVDLCQVFRHIFVDKLQCDIRNLS